MTSSYEKAVISILKDVLPNKDVRCIILAMLQSRLSALDCKLFFYPHFHDFPQTVLFVCTMKNDLLIRVDDYFLSLIEFDFISEDCSRIDLKERELGYRYAFFKETEELSFSPVCSEDGYSLEETEEHLMAQ